MNKNNEETNDTLKPELSFHIVRPHNQMIWHGNLDLAMAEYFRAKKKQIDEQAEIIQASEKEGKDWPDGEKPIGAGKDNLFIASNGIMMWYDNQGENYPETLTEYVERFTKQIDETINMAKQYKYEVEDLMLAENESVRFSIWIEALEQLKKNINK